ncbi:hypothetical protein PMAYCL1PPCAC_03255, partial [Pristionchus mayeri]
SQVSTHFHAGVKEFMKKNRPAIGCVDFVRVAGALVTGVGFFLIPANLPFFGLETLDSGRYERWGTPGEPSVHVDVNGLEDPICEQVSDLLSSPIQRVNIYHGFAGLSPNYPPLCAHLLRAPTSSTSPLARRTSDCITPARYSSLIRV